MTSSGPGPSPVGIPVPQSEGAKDMLALRGPRREAATHALPRHPGPTPGGGPHVQKHSELGVAGHTRPQGWFGSSTATAQLCPDARAPGNARNLLYGEPRSREGSREFQNQEEKPASSPHTQSREDARIPAALGHWLQLQVRAPGLARTTRSRAHTTSWRCPWGAARGGSRGHSAPDPAEPWPLGVASARPLGWTQRPLTWSCKFLLPRGPNTACA